MIYGRKTKTTELMEKFRNELQAQRMEKDSPVMSARELALHFGISPSTANNILTLLVKDGFLYRKKRSGTFIKNNPPVIPSIAYAGPLPDPEDTNPAQYHALLHLLEHFTELGLEPKLISYHTLRHPEQAQRELGKTNGLLIDGSFIDRITRKTLWDYPGIIAVKGSYFKESGLSCSQVIPDFTPPLLEFNRVCPFSEYDKILIVRASHQNSAAAAENVLRVLDRLSVPEKKIGTVVLETSGSINAYLLAGRYFSKHRDLPENTLIVCMSEYFSQAIREVYISGKFMPDILSFNNLEGYMTESDVQPWFTSVDCQAGTAACRALDLLCEQLMKPKPEQTLIQLPAKLIIRESVKSLCRSSRTAKI